MKESTCSKCKLDHSKPNTGPLTECEREAYFAQGGAMGIDPVTRKKIRGFGIGQSRFQINDKL